MSRQDVHAHIDAHLEEHIDKIAEYVRQPTVSQTGEGIAEGVELLARYLRELGCAEVEVVPTDGHPGVFAYYDAGAPVTIVTYAMYDVQPVKADEWTHPPFSAALVPMDGHPRVLVGRGSWFAKGPFRAFLNALESIIAVDGTLPVNVYFVAEGEEEIASPHFEQVVEPYADRLRTADAVLTLGAAQDAAGRVPVFLGNKGFVYFDLVARGDGNGHGPLRAAVHDSLQGVVGSPAWRLVQALSTLMDTDGRVTIDGFGDDVRGPSEADRELLSALLAQLAGPGFTRAFPNLSGEGRVDRFGDLTDEAALETYVTRPTLNVNGIRGGFTGPGTVNFSIPQTVTAALDCRLVPDMEPQPFLDALRAHLDRHGFADVEIDVKSRYTWAKTEASADVVQACLRAYRDMGAEVVVWPSKGTSGVWWVFNRYLGLPTVKEGGLGFGGGFHAADEYLVIDSGGPVGGLADCEKSHVDILYSFGLYPGPY